MTIQSTDPEMSGARPCRILFVNSTSEVGGADVDLLEICRCLDRGRFSPIVVLPHEGPLSLRFEAAGVRMVYCDTAPVKHFRTVGEIVGYPCRLLWTVVTLWRLIRREGVQIVHVNTAVLPAAGYAAWLAGAFCVWHVREIELLQRSRIVGAFLRTSMRICASRIVAISHAVAAGLGPWATARTRVIYHGVDIERFVPNASDCAVRNEYHIPGDAAVIGYVGRLSPIKGLSGLITAFSEVRGSRRDAYLLLVGPVLGYQAHVEDLQREANDLGLAEFVIFATACEDVASAIRAMDVVVIPTLVPEGLGLAILESLATGRPVVATNHGGPVEILADCLAARLIPPRNSAAIATAVTEILDAPEDRRRALSAEARAWAVERFGIHRMITELMDVYRVAA